MNLDKFIILNKFPAFWLTERNIFAQNIGIWLGVEANTSIIDLKVVKKSHSKK